MLGWYVINTLPNQEIRAELNLKRQGFRTWLPFFRKKRRHARKVDIVKAPVFPGYMFVFMDLETEQWSPINGTFGVRRILCQNNRPALVPEEFIRTLENSIDDAGFVTSTEKQYKEGEKVKLLDGPFAESIAVFLEMSGSDRVALLMNVLGSEIRTTVPKYGISSVE